MEGTKWEERLNALVHILASPSTTPSLHSQLFIATQLPSYHRWHHYPPLLAASCAIRLRWEFSYFLRRTSRLGLPVTSWRCKCPYHIPPPLILAEGVEEARWDEEGMRAYARKRLFRKIRGSRLNRWFVILVPNLLALSLLLWNPFPDSDQ
ncbi:hypothetical protein Droror1_Dr00010383 [Drosera rotundifolia]